MQIMAKQNTDKAITSDYKQIIHANYEDVSDYCACKYRSGKAVTGDKQDVNTNFWKKIYINMHTLSDKN